MNGREKGSVGQVQDLLRLGQFDKVEEVLGRVIADDPSDLEAHFILGMIKGRSQDWASVKAHLELVVANQKDRLEALYWLGIANRNLGDPVESIRLLKQAEILAPSHPPTLNELALSFLKANDSASALRTIERAVVGNPTAGPLLQTQGLVLATLDRVEDARNAFARAVFFSPELLESHLQLAMQLERLSEWTEGEKHLKNALARFPDHPTLLGMFGRTLTRLGRLQEAESALRHAFDVDPTAGAAFALWLQEQGRFEESIDVLWQSIERHPHQGAAFYGLTEAKVFGREATSLLSLANEALRPPALEASEEVFLHFAIGKVYETDGQFDSAWKHFEHANRAAFGLYNAGRPFDRLAHSKMREQTVEHYSKSTLKRRMMGMNLEPEPIIVVGMIRSGTTLLDQILSSHPRIQSAGEQTFWMLQAHNLRRDGNPHLSDAELDRLVSEYAETLRNTIGEPSGTHVIDKMPLNYGALGLIHEALPASKIVHIRRDPLDTMVSIYTNHFGHGPNFAYNKGNILFHYQEYLALMAHWRNAMPAGTLLEIDYEDLVRNRESVTRRVLQFCGVPWDESCLEHTKNLGMIQTPSRWQARQPLYTSSIGRWKSYEPWLGEFLEIGKSNN